jgi:uncharacterized flavoprotein (TIGR03862 family)
LTSVEAAAPSQGVRVAVVGGGPSGLRAAEVAAAGGADVTLFDAKSSVGRKFLVAGRGGLNLTHDEPAEDFRRRYSGPGQPEGLWTSMLADFDPAALRAWAAGLGVETFAAGTGRVYPREMKAAPLLRRWVERLRAAGVRFRLRHRWTGLRRDGDAWHLDFDHDGTIRTEAFDGVVLALGGGSWPETGSDGGWVDALVRRGVSVAPLAPANCGWEVAWPAEVLEVAEGKPLKNLRVHAGTESVDGELLVTRYGLEGGALYALGAALRAMPEPEIRIDFKPSVAAEALSRRLGVCRRNFLAEGTVRWRLGPAVAAVVAHAAGGQEFRDAGQLVAAVKECRLRLVRPRPIAEAISSAGGVRWSELDDDLMIRSHPGVFVAGEMVDWEAPTGGYLMQGCFATGTRAARGVLRWIARGSDWPR